jgi:hypothetical protein
MQSRDTASLPCLDHGGSISEALFGLGGTERGVKVRLLTEARSELSCSLPGRGPSGLYRPIASKLDWDAGSHERQADEASESRVSAADSEQQVRAQKGKREGYMGLRRALREAVDIASDRASLRTRQPSLMIAPSN